MATTATNRIQLLKSVTGPNRRITFERKDFGILDLALDQSPELRICAGVVKVARAAKLKYPVTSSEALSGLLPVKQIVVEGHWLRAELIGRYLSKEFFPIRDERELITRCYVGLMRCREEMAWAARAPDHALSLLREFAQATANKGGN